MNALDAIVLTHPDRDHAGGLAYILEHFPTAAFYVGLTGDDSDVQRSLLQTCERLGVPVRRIARGDRFVLGGASLDVLHPPRDWGKSHSENDRSLVLRVSWDNFSALLTGDIESEGEEALIRYDCRADLVKVPHHGSLTSSSQAFIESVAPKVAAVSSGRFRRKTVTSIQVEQRYKDRHADVYNTSVYGGVRVTASAGPLEVDTARQLRGYPLRQPR